MDRSKWNLVIFVLCLCLSYCYLVELKSAHHRTERETTCPDSCRSCNSTGQCDRCRLGYYGDRCQERCTSCACALNGTCLVCSRDRWGADCSKPCPENCEYMCDLDTGECDSCKEGFFGPKCSKQCDPNCRKYSLASDTTCDMKTGTCGACVDGLWGTYCNETCQVGCRVCERDTGVCGEYDCLEGYGGDHDCDEKVDSFCCSHKCTNPRCSKCGLNEDREYCYRCKTGYFGRECRFNDPYAERCKNVVRSPYESTLASGKCECPKGSYGYACEHKCPENCNYCSDAHACTECKDGFYGSFCNLTCAPGCSKCSIDGRKCYTCSDPDLIGSKCQCRRSECNYLSFSRKCLHCKRDNWQPAMDGCCPCTNCADSCSYMVSSSRSAICVGGCKPGFFGTGCDEGCSPNCVTVAREETCSSNAHCLHGCQEGYVEPKCTVKCSDAIAYCKKCAKDEDWDTICKECESGYFPDEDGVCRSCTHCKNSNCDSRSGRCLSTCAEGYYTSASKSGDYNTCESKCSFTCRDRRCDPLTGRCLACRDGYYGDMCERECSSNCGSVACNQGDSSCSPCQTGYWTEGCWRRCSEHCVGGCDVDGTCKECETGWGGKTCNNDCSNCISGLCNQFDGCPTCKPGSGYSGKYCREKCTSRCFVCSKMSHSCVKCKTGYWEDFARGYATFCQPCGEGCKNTLESHYDPTQNYTECPTGKHGLSCDKDCPVYCQSGTNTPASPCDLFTGACSLGCIDGHYGNTCEEKCGRCTTKNNGSHICSIDGKCDECELGFHGRTCDEGCSVNCIDSECNRVTGVCLKGCKEGFRGRRCNYVSTASTIQTSVIFWLLLLIHF